MEQHIGVISGGIIALSPPSPWNYTYELFRSRVSHIVECTAGQFIGDGGL